MSKRATETAQDIRFRGGPMDGEQRRMAKPLPDVLWLDMGRAEYRSSGGQTYTFVEPPVGESTA